jgi:5'-nucleotidase
MHILLVNDDGIQSIGIRALCEAARARGHRVSICAPSAQQSAASQRITLADPIYVKEYDFGFADVAAYAITGTPTDCVRLGLFELVREPVDVLISGINDGFNAGMAVHYSGTVGAATEAALNRVRAMAVSVHHKASKAMYDHTATLAIAAAEGYVTLAVPHATVLNLNAPLREPAEVLPPVLAPLSVANFKDSYIRRESPRAGVYYWMSNEYSMEPPEAGSDLYWLDKGHVTVTFMGNPCEHGAEHTAFVEGIAASALPPL